MLVTKWAKASYGQVDDLVSPFKDQVLQVDMETFKLSFYILDIRYAKKIGGYFLKKKPVPIFYFLLTSGACSWNVSEGLILF